MRMAALGQKQPLSSLAAQGLLSANSGRLIRYMRAAANDGHCRKLAQTESNGRKRIRGLFVCACPCSFDLAWAVCQICAECRSQHAAVRLWTLSSMSPSIRPIPQDDYDRNDDNNDRNEVAPQYNIVTAKLAKWFAYENTNNRRWRT